MRTETAPSAIASRHGARAAFAAAQRSGGFLVGAAVGTGLAAEAAAAGEADFLLAVGAGRFRMMGAASVTNMLPVRNANAFAADWAAAEVLPRRRQPVLLGVSALDPNLDSEALLQRARADGFSGVACFPTSAHYDDPMRTALDRAGLGYRRELAVLRQAQALGLYTLAYAVALEEVEAAADAGIDMICLNFGWTSWGARAFGAVTPLEEAALRAREAARLIRRSKSAALLLLEGGAIQSPADMTAVFRSAPVDGYIGGSTIDRLPFEEAVAARTLSFKRAARAARVLSDENRRLAELGAALGIPGASAPLLEALSGLERLCASEQPIALSGEPGVGRQRVAESIAQSRGCRFEALDAADLTERQFMVALFGGGAQRESEGLAVQAQRTLVLLRDPHRLTFAQQRRIARFCESGRFRPLGGRRERHSRLMLCLAFPDRIARLAETGAIDPRLALAVSGREVTLPPLRDRPEDISTLLAAAFEHHGVRGRRVTPAALRRLETHPWPGNLVELDAIVDRLLRRGDDPISEEAVIAALEPIGLKARPQTERALILDALWRCGFHRGKTAALLGISRKTLYNKIRSYRLVE